MRRQEEIFKPKLTENRKYRKEALRYTKYSERFNICVIKIPGGEEHENEAGKKKN